MTCGWVVDPKTTVWVAVSGITGRQEQFSNTRRYELFQINRSAHIVERSKVEKYEVRVQSTFVLAEGQEVVV